MPDMINVTQEQIRAAYEHGCEECVQMGATWVTLRMCLNCGKVGCCDSSPNKHASKHWRESGHNMMRSIEPGDAWTYDFATGRLDEPEYKQ
jgi:monovalent cation/hydrogen antiporter